MSTIAPANTFIPPVRGVRYDLDPFIVGLDGLRDAENWYFNSQGEFVPRGGLSQLGENVIAGERVMGFFQYMGDDGVLRLVVATNAGWHRYVPPPDGNVFTDITGTALTGADTDHPTFRTFRRGNNIFLLGVNGKNPPKVWNGTSPTYSNVGGTPPIAQCIAVNNRHVILANLKSGEVISPAAFDVSAIQDFDNGWNGVTQRGLVDADEIVCLLELGNQITTAFCRSAIGFFIAQAVDSAPFRFEIRVPDVIGPASLAACVNGKRGTQYFLARDLSVQMFDGTRNESLGPHIQAYLQKKASEDYLDLAHGCFDHTDGKLYYFFVGRDAGFVWRGICIDLNRSNALYPLYFDEKHITASGLAVLQNGVTQVVMGDSDGKVYEDTGSADDGAAMPSFFETGLTPWERQYKTLQNIEHGFVETIQSQQVTVMIGKTNHAEIRKLGRTIGELEGTIGDLDGDIFSLAGHRLIDLQSPPFNTDHRTTGRSFSLRYEANVSEPGVRYRGASLALAPRGLR